MVEKIVTPGVHLPAGGHTGQAVGVTVIKGYRMFRQTLEIRRLGPGISAGEQVPPVKGIDPHHYHYRFHTDPLETSAFDRTYHNTFDKVFLDE
jgi:hypothetical protein